MDDGGSENLNSERVSAATRRADMRRSIIDGSFYSVMMGLGEMYIPAFVLAVGLGEVFSGLVATLPQMVGGVVQLVSVVGPKWVGGGKQWVLVCVAAQALAFVPLFVGAILGWMPAWAVFASATLYWAGGMSAGTAWTTWIAGVVPGRGGVRSRYFGLRQRALQVGQLTGFLVGGIALKWLSGSTGVLLVFAGLFAAAGIARGVSWMMLERIHEPRRDAGADRVVGARELLKRLLHRGGGRDAKLLGYMFAVTFVVFTASPFFAPYQLEHLKLDYFLFAGMMGSVLLGKMLALPWLGALGARIGARRLLWIGAVGIVAPSAVWGVTQEPWVLFAAQLVSGAAWGAYELSTWLLQLEHLHERERTSLMAAYFCGNTLAMGLGTLVGAGLLKAMGTTAGAYMVLFVISSGLRLLLVLVLPAVAGPAGGDDAGAGGGAGRLARRALRLVRIIPPEVDRVRE